MSAGSGWKTKARHEYRGNAPQEVEIAISTILIIVIPLVILFFFLNIAARGLLNRLQEIKIQTEHENALEVSLNLDFKHESKSLKRVEVDEPKARIL